MPSADPCRLSLASRPGLPLTRLDDRSPRVRTLTFPAHLPHLLLWPLIALGFVVSRQLARPHSLFMGFVSLRSQICLRLPSDPASRRRPCLQLTVGAINLRKGLPPSSQRPCRAHVKNPAASCGASSKEKAKMGVAAPITPSLPSVAYWRLSFYAQFPVSKR